MSVVGSLGAAALSNVIRLAACSAVKDLISLVSFGKFFGYAKTATKNPTGSN
jgi:hypothetical protein